MVFIQEQKRFVIGQAASLINWNRTYYNHFLDYLLRVSIALTVQNIFYFLQRFLLVVSIFWTSWCIIWCSHSRAPAFVYNFNYGSLLGYWPCTVWSFLDRYLPQKLSQISSPLFQQIDIYHPMLGLFSQSIFTWGPSFILCEFFEIFLKPCSPAETDLCFTFWGGQIPNRVGLDMIYDI